MNLYVNKKNIFKMKEHFGYENKSTEMRLDYIIKHHFHITALHKYI